MPLKDQGGVTMAVPKGKVSKASGALHLPHRMCQECGTYNGREVKVVKSVVAK